MFVNAPRAYKRPNLSFRLENNLSRTSIHTVHIGRIYLVIRTQNKAEFSIWGVEMLRKLLLNVNCGVKTVILCLN